MIWYKAFREMQIRLLLAAAIITAFCLYAVFAPPADAGMSHDESVYQRIYFGSAKGVFALLLLFLGLGGLRRESARLTAAFTLALPVSRLHLTVVPMTIGVLAMAALALLPAALLPLLSPLAHQTFSPLIATQFSLLWFCCGAPVLAAAFLFSAVLSVDMTALSVGFVALIFEGVVISLWTDGSLLAVMSGFGTVQNPLSGSPAFPFPTTRLIAYVFLALALFFSSVCIARRQDY